MKKGIIGKKIGMTQIFDEATNKVIPLTVVEVGPCVVVQKKTVEALMSIELPAGVEIEIKA